MAHPDRSITTLQQRQINKKKAETVYSAKAFQDIKTFKMAPRSGTCGSNWAERSVISGQTVMTSW